MGNLTSQQQVSALCVTCGACCDGSLFTHGDIDQDDDLTPMLVGPIENKGDKILFPCPCLDGATCTNYEDRPKICRMFFCALAMRVQDGDITLDQAMAQKDAALRDFQHLREVFDIPEGALKPEVDAYMGLYRQHEKNQDFQRENAQKIKAVAAYQQSRKIFSPRKKRIWSGLYEWLMGPQELTLD